MTALDKLKKEWNDNPVQTAMVGSFVATAAAKLISAMSESRGRRAYAKQVNYKIRNRK